MDENYLDSLLNEVSLDKEIDHKIEDELDDQIAREKEEYHAENSMSDDDLFNLDLEKDADFETMDSDLLFSEDQMEELDHLDHLADLDIGDLDFSDIDFDDLDITKLDDLDDTNLDDLLNDFDGDFEIEDSMYENAADGDKEELLSEKESFEEPEQEETVAQSLENRTEDLKEALDEELNEDHFDTDQFLDDLLEETEMEAATQQPAPEIVEEDATIEDLLSKLSDEPLQELSQEPKEQTEPGEDVQTEAPIEELSSEDENALDDLFSLLDLDEDYSSDASGKMESAEADASLELSELEELEDIGKSKESIKATTENKKRSFMQILFGDPDEEDELSEAELAAIEEKKAAKKAKKQAAKEAKKEKKEAAKAEKDTKNSQKKKEDAEKKKVKAERKAKKKAEELANAEPEKKLNKPAVLFIFSFVFGGVFLLYLAANNFNYTMAIEMAANYFSNQKYHKAYDEIKGVEVKEKDQELKDRIYTVMYVERLYESYENNISMGRPEKALDSLLRGVEKYYIHYDEAKELGIVSDLDYSFSQIQTVLMEKYGISVEQAVQINDLENAEYVQLIQDYVNKQEPEENLEIPDKEDAVLPEEEEVTE